MLKNYLCVGALRLLMLNAIAMICFLLLGVPIAPLALPSFLLSAYSSAIFLLTAFLDVDGNSGLIYIVSQRIKTTTNDNTNTHKSSIISLF